MTNATTTISLSETSYTRSPWLPLQKKHHNITFETLFIVTLALRTTFCSGVGELPSNVLRDACENSLQAAALSALCSFSGRCSLGRKWMENQARPGWADLLRSSRVFYPGMILLNHSSFVASAWSPTCGKTSVQGTPPPLTSLSKLLDSSDVFWTTCFTFTCKKPSQALAATDPNSKTNSISSHHNVSDSCVSCTLFPLQCTPFAGER